MQILGMGLDLEGRRLFEPVEATAFTERLIEGLAVNGPRIQRTYQTTNKGIVFRSEQERKILDVGDPKTAGWTFLVNQADPKRSQIIEALKPLAAHRGMERPDSPLSYTTSDPADWGSWLDDNYLSIELQGKKVPRYILIVGGPDQVPFGFQSLLDSVASVGRLDFSAIEQLAGYVDKVIRIEKAAAPVVTRDAVVFATDAGPSDPTYFSRRYMAEPIADLIEKDFQLKTTRLLGDAATKNGLLSTLKGSTAALVYSASHGLGAISEPAEVQERYNGALCCQTAGPLTLDGLLTAEDVPADTEPFLEGAVFFQFACFGYGTPAMSEYSHWLSKNGKETKNTDRDFVAALPKRLLAHPKGPIGFIGHLDTAFLHGFADASAPETLDRWHNRIQPFVSAIRMLLEVQASGLAMQAMNDRYSTLSALLANTYDRIQRGKMQWTEASEARFLDSWITRGDAQNYMVLGDPGTRIRLPA